MMKTALRSEALDLARAALLILLLLFSSSCVHSFKSDAESIIQRYVHAVQHKDFKTLYELSADRRDESKLLAGPEREDHFENFKGVMEEQFQRYESGRDEGWLDFEPDGIVLVKGLVLGKGTFYEIEGIIKLPGSVACVDTVVRLGYGHINYDTLPQGTVAYLLGYPIGTVERLEIQPAGRVTRKVIRELNVRWWFESRERSEISPSGWYFKSVEPLPGTVQYETLTWAF